MSSNKKKTGSMSTLNIVLIIQLIIMLGLSVFITLTVSQKTKKNAIDHMKAIGDERAKIIASYVDNAEKTLTYYSKSAEVYDMFKNPDDAAKKAAAQEYTERYAKDIDHNEGLWSGTLETEVMTHSSASKNPALIGMFTRSKRGEDGKPLTDESGKVVLDEDRVNQLIDAIEAAGPDGVYNTGIIISPGSGEQCLSLYKGVYDGSKLIGFVGLGIYTDGMLDTLNNISIPDMKKATYSMVNMADKHYIFNSKIAEKVTADNAAEVTAETKQKEMLDLIDKYSDVDAEDDDITDEYEYEDGGKDYVATYTVIPKYGWILTVDDETSEVYALNRTMIIYLSIFAVIIVCLTIVFYFITKRQQAINEKLVSTIAKANRTKKSLNTAMFKDVLTGASNRISFSMDMEKAEDKEPCFFAMFNICNFSEINSAYGQDAGDRLLVRAVEDLKDFFQEEQIYRTGSDEFVVSVKTENGAPGSDEMLEKINNAFRQLLVPERLDNGKTIYPKYKVAAIRRTQDINISVVSELKDITNKDGESSYGMIEIHDQ